MLRQEFIAAARIERRHLFRELQKNPTFKQWWALRQLITAYGHEADGEDDNLGIVTPPPAPSSASSGAKQSRPGSRASQIEAATAAWFRGRATRERAQSLEIMRALEQGGFTFEGAKPTAALASILSHSDLFDNVRGEGYGLRSWTNTEPALGLDEDPTGTPEPDTRTATHLESPFER